MEETKHMIDVSNRMYKIPVVAVTVLAIFLAGVLAYQFQSLPQNQPMTVSVSGEGKMYAKPDIAIISFGAHTESLKSQEAVDKNNTIMNAVISAMKALGIEEKDIQTTGYNVNPIYDYTQSGRTFRGYSIDQQIQVKIRNFDKISAVLDKATMHGANTVSDLRFTVDDIEAVRSEARAKAITEAKAKAKSLFGQAGLRLGRLVNVSEGYNTPSPLLPYGGGYAGAMMKESVAPDIQAGQMEVTSTVTLTYQIK